MLMELAKKALASPGVFGTYQSLIGAPGCHRRFIHEMVRPIRGERILDIGCGVGASDQPNDELRAWDEMVGGGPGD